MPSEPPPRALLRTEPAPTTASPMVVTLTQPVGIADKLTISYVPDRDILQAGALAKYIASQPSLQVFGRETQLEGLAATIADDFADQVVPRWHRVTLQARNYVVTVEDRQPGWDHPTLLSSVPRPLRPRRP